MMNEHDLRRALQDVEAPDGRSASQLSEMAISRGRTIRRQQTALTAFVVAAIAAAGIGVSTLLPGSDNAVPASRVESPSPSPTASASTDVTPEIEEDGDVAVPVTPEPGVTTPGKTADPSARTTTRPTTPPMTTEQSSPERTRAADLRTEQGEDPATTAAPTTPRARRPVEDPDATETASEVVEAPEFVWDDASRLPGDIGDLGDYKLAGESYAGDEWTTAYEPLDFPVSQCRESTIPALTRIVAGRTAQSQGQDWSDTEGILLFATNDDAAAFMAESRALSAACVSDELWFGDEAPSEVEPDVGVSFHLRDGAIGDQSYIASSDSTIIDLETGKRSPYPGGELRVVSRSGRVVVFGMSYGKYGYDPGTGEGGILDQVSGTVRQNLANADAEFN